MWVCHLRNGVRRNVAKLPDAVLVVERFPAFTRQHDIQRSECFASVGVAVLRVALVEGGTDDSNEGIRRNRGARMR